MVQSADVAEARKLKQAHINAALLKEKLIGEKSRADRAEASLAELADVQVRVKEMESELQRWSEVVEKIPGAQSRDDILPKFAALQRLESHSVNSLRNPYFLPQFNDFPLLAKLSVIISTLVHKFC